MDNKKVLAGGLLVCVLSIIALWPEKPEHKFLSYEPGTLEISNELISSQEEEFIEEEEKENPIDRDLYEFKMLMDPATGTIPDNIIQREIAFAKEHLNKSSISLSQSPAGGVAGTNTLTTAFLNRGPFNIGGRTRAVALDVTDENIILAGGVSGGMWRTTDQGTTWTRVSSLEQHPSITALIQDTRDGKTTDWYYSTGERRGNSAGATGATYFGNGIYKSTDSGVTWNLIASTSAGGADGTGAFTTRETFSQVDELAMDYSNTDDTEIYAAANSEIIRSTDGFATFDIVLGATNEGNNWTDVAITSTGKVFATIGNTDFNGTNTEEGVFKSDDGITWTSIEPPTGFNGNVPRIEIAINPSNEGIIYFLTDDQLFLYDDVNDTWTDLSDNIGFSADTGEGYNTQGAYDQYVAVHPTDEQTVYIAGTNILRSTDRFLTGTNRKQIAGYLEDGNSNSFPQYPNHHPDQHDFVFFPSDANKMLTGSDGGVHLTENNLADNGSTPVIWQSLNNGYVTTQFYDADINNYDIGDNSIIGGLQDNGTVFTNSADPTADWRESLGGDGTFTGITYNAIYHAFQRGGLRRAERPAGTIGVIFNQNIRPTNNDGDYLFVNPFLNNPVDHEQMFVAANNRVFFHNDIRTTPGDGEWSTIIAQGMGRVTAFGMSVQPEAVLYIGTQGGNIFKVDDTRELEDGFEATKIDGANMPNGNVSSIAVDPADANKVIATFSNYGVISVWYSEDGGTTWNSISGNIEENVNGSGAGPSVRAVEIMPGGVEGSYYFLGTSVGLFMTQQLDGDNTVWEQQAPEQVGNVVVSSVRVRAIDGTVMASTHGNGIFVGQYDVPVAFPHINYSASPDRTSFELRANVSYDANNRLAYQWFKDDAELTGENDITLTVTDGGDYQVRVTRESGGEGMSNIISINLDGAGPDIASVVRLSPTTETTDATTVQFRVTFSENTLNVTADDFVVTGDVMGTVSEVVEETANLVFDVTVTNIGGAGTLGLSVRTDGTDITDEVGNPFSGNVISAETYTIVDSTAPNVSILRSNPTDELTDSNEVVFSVSFNETVVNVDMADFELAASTPQATLSSVTAVSGSSYEVTVSEILEDGVIDLDFSASNDIEDASGNAFEGTINTEQTYTIENVVSSIDETLLREVNRIIVDANPSDGFYNLAFPNQFIGDFTLQVIDAAGRSMQRLSVSGYNSGEQVQVDLRSFQDGVFIVRAANEGHRATIRLIKSNQ